MNALASSTVTWGITGPTFLVGYAVLAAVALLGIIMARRRIAGEVTAQTATAEMSPQDIAYLNGGPELAALSALSSMHVAGTITVDGQRRVQAAGRLASSSGELERAIHLAAASPLPRHRLAKNRIVHSALENSRKRLTDAGLLLSVDQQRRIRLAGFWMVAVAGFGLVRVLAGLSNGAPVAFLVLELIGVGVVAAILLTRIPTHSPRAAAELSQLRQQHNALAPGMRPDWAAYGPTYAALGVGIFGAGALWASDPAFAAEVQAQKVTAASGASGGYYSGGDSSGGGWSGGGDSGGGGGGGCGGGCGGGGS